LSKASSQQAPVAFSERPVTVYEMPLKAKILHCERVVLKFGDNSVDIGALCYLRRPDSAMYRRKWNQGRQVDLGSFDAARANQIRDVITQLSERISAGGSRMRTAEDTAKGLIRFMDWADQSGHKDVLSGQKAPYEGFRAYVHFLRERVNRHETKPSTGANSQHTVLTFLERFTGLHDLHRGINLLNNPKNSGGGTEPPAEEDLARSQGLCDALFTGLSDFVLNESRYPFRLPMPKSLGWKDDFLWVFPTRKWCMPPHFWESRKQLKSGYWAYDYAQGRLATLDEMRQHYGSQRRASIPLKNAEALITKANADPRHIWRIMAAMLAHNALVFLFIADTGWNLAQVLDVGWNPKITIGTAQQGFREIKYRAGGNPVSIVIRHTFLPHFKRFLELRTYLLNGQPHDKLFLTLGTNGLGSPGDMKASRLASFYQTLRMIDPSLPWVLPKKLRAATQDYLIRNTDPETSAVIMGHSKETSSKNYSAGSKTTQYGEMSNFLDKVLEKAHNKIIVLKKDEPVPNGLDGAVGTCANFNEPHPFADNVPVKPDCIHPDGCLFCANHRVHPDEKDTRKLASARYVVCQITYLPGSEAHFRPVHDRIQSLLDEIKSRDGNEEMVDRVVREVDEGGELDAYWETKLALVNDLEISYDDGV